MSLLSRLSVAIVAAHVVENLGTTVPKSCPARFAAEVAEIVTPVGVISLETIVSNALLLNAIEVNENLSTMVDKPIPENHARESVSLLSAGVGIVAIVAEARKASPNARPRAPCLFRATLASLGEVADGARRRS